MNARVRTTRWLGAAFVAQFVTSVAAGILSAKVLGAGPAGALAASASNMVAVRASAMLDVLTAAGIVALTTLLFAVLGDDDRPRALVAMAMWLAEAIMLGVAGLGLYGLAALAPGASTAGIGAATSLAGAGTLAFSIYENAFTVSMFFFCIGGLLWYSLLYRTEVVPRWLAGWGFLGTLPLLVSITLTLWDRALGLGVIAGIPYVPFECILGIWLMVFAERSAAAHHGIARGSAPHASAPGLVGGAL